jgi:hypothetical protein
MRYPTESPGSALGSGSAVYLYLLENIAVPSRLPHKLWYEAQKIKLKDQHDPFRGFFPIGETLEISYGGSEVGPHTFTGEERNPVYVRDLSDEALMQLGIRDANPKDKVWNPNYVKYEDLPENARISNETATMSLAKSISAFLCTKGDIMYTEIDVVDMLTTAVRNCNSDEMRYILHGNHVAWCAARYIETGIMEEDIKRQFYGQNDTDFYVKDIGTIMPGMLFTLAILGFHPMEVIQELTYDIFDIKSVAKELQQYMKINQKKEEKEAA